VRPEELGQDITEAYRKGVTRAVESRKYHDPASFMDLQFSDILSNKAAATERIDAHFNFGFWDGWEHVINASKQMERCDKKGHHKYSAKHFGINSKTIRKDFEQYMSYYNVPYEADQNNQTTTELSSSSFLWKMPALSFAVLVTTVFTLSLVAGASIGWTVDRPLRHRLEVHGQNKEEALIGFGKEPIPLAKHTFCWRSAYLIFEPPKQVYVVHLCFTKRIF
jgi:hypothetical protein